jgi:hypothetical protein
MALPFSKGSMSAHAWVCPTCEQTRRSTYCKDCGERVLHGHDLTMVGLVEHGVEAVTHLDGRVLQTFRSLLTRPGMLTAGYIRGQRKPFLGPLQVFLLANLLFFALQSLMRFNLFSTPLASQVRSQFYSATARELVDRRLAALQVTQAEYAPAFDHAVGVNAKSMIILMTPLMALVLALLFIRRRSPVVTHAVFSIHFYAFFLVMVSVLLPAMIVIFALLKVAAGVALSSRQLDAAATVVFLSVATRYLYGAIGRVYSVRGLPRILAAAALTPTVALTVIGYRAAIFIITLYTTSSSASH